MKIIVTGSLGNVGRPLSQQLVAANHKVTVVSHSEERKKDIEAIGATPAIGRLDDDVFLTNVFSGADAVFAMTPPAYGASGIVENTIKTGKALAKAIQEARVPRVVMLSSIGADQPDGNGPIKALYHLEKQYSELNDTSFVFLRAGYFYLNFLQNIPLVKNAGIIGYNVPADMNFPLVHPRDIAAVAAQYLQGSFTGKQVKYVVSDIRTPKEVAAVIGASIDKPSLPWVEFTDEQTREGMLGAGLPAELADLFTEMGAGLRTGLVAGDFIKSGSPVDGKVKLEHFSKEFAAKFFGKAVEAE